MKEIEINEINLRSFYKIITLNDYKELCYYFENNTMENFIKLCCSNKDGAYFLADDNNIPVAIGGACKTKYPFKNSAKLWLLCTKQAMEHRIELFKFIKNKIIFFRKKYDFLFNYIYKSNFNAIKWLKLYGFSIIDTDDENFKIFILKRRI